MISYAQNFEDVILARVFAGRTQGFYVDVGASDPIVGSVTKHFYELGWSGVNVEPEVRVHAALVHDRPRDANLNVALGRERGTLTFFDFETMGISTLSAEFAEHFAREGKRYTKRPVEVVPLREICEAHCRGSIDFMKIDVEGFEREVLEGGDWTRFRPRVLVVEATRPNSTVPTWQDWEPFILGQRYLFAYFDGLNRFYVAEEERPLLERLQVPPNVHDGFVLYEHHLLREQMRELREGLTVRGFVPFLLRRISTRLRKRHAPGV
jgi:FkbM family methyltransferase